MAYSIDPIQDNCYPGTTVLVNKLHIHDEAALPEAETLATYVNASKLEQCPLEGVFDFAHYKAIHRVLFSDLLHQLLAEFKEIIRVNVQFKHLTFNV